MAPGLVRTPMAAAIPDDPSPLQASEKLYPLGRIGEPNEIASPMARLLGPESSSMTGGILHLDGGMARVRTAAR